MTKRKQKKPKRAYDNTSRIKSSQGNQKLIIETLVQLLVEKKGGEVTFNEVAKRAGVSAQTIFRFFKDKEDLHKAMDEYLLYYLKAGVEKINDLNVAGFTKNAYELFDQHEDLVVAYLYSPFGQKARRMFRQKLNRVLIDKILEQKRIKVSKDIETKLAVIVSLVNANLWHDIRSDFGFSGKEMGQAFEWAVNALLADL